MKLKLASEKNVDILTASESITAKDISVLKAGITKLFQNGKNKIVFEVPSGGLPPEVIRELGLLDNFARELSGRVVVVSGDPEVLRGIQSFASPPLVLCYARRAEAVASFTPPPPLDAKPDEAGAAASVPPPHGLTKDEYLARELGDLGKLRVQLSNAERENKLLHDHLVRQVAERRQTGEIVALAEKIQALEQEIEKLLYPPAKAK